MATIVSDAAGPSGAARWSADQETQLVDGLRAGRRDAFERLYELYSSRIYNLTLRIVQSPEDACDITQDVFIKAFHKLPDSAVSGPHLTPWLYRVAVNASYDHLRTRKVHRDIDDPATDPPVVSVDTFEQAEMSRRVEQTLTGLSERHRTALILKDIHGLRHDEMAEILGVSRGATETLLFRAREAFRNRYLELTQGQPGSHNVEKWGAAGIGIGVFLHDAPLPAALQGGFSFLSAGAGVAGAGAGAAGAGAGAGGATTGGAAAAGAATGASAAGTSSGLTLAAGGLLAKVGGAAAVKLTAVVVAATCAAGGGVAAYEAGALPGSPHHRPAVPAQSQGPWDGQTAGAASAGHGASPGRDDPSKPTGAARAAAARERAAEKKAAKEAEKDARKAAKAAEKDTRLAAKAAEKDTRKAAQQARKEEKAASGKAGGQTKDGGVSGQGTKGGDSSGNNGGGGKGGNGNNAGNGDSEKPDKPDKPDKGG